MLALAILGLAVFVTGWLLIGARLDGYELWPRVEDEPGQGTGPETWPWQTDDERKG